MRIVDKDTGEPITGNTGKAALRSLTVLITNIPYLGTIFALINAIMVLASPHRSLYDRAAGTRVVKD